MSRRVRRCELESRRRKPVADDGGNLRPGHAQTNCTIYIGDATKQWWTRWHSPPRHLWNSGSMRAKGLWPATDCISLVLIGYCGSSADRRHVDCSEFRTILNSSCYSNGSDRPHRHRTDRSLVIARWRLCVPPGPHLIHESRESTTKRHLDRSVQQLLQRPRSWPTLTDHATSRHA